MDKTYNVLFLCTGNSARSVLAEVLLAERGKGRFRSFSAGSHPAGQVNPFTLKTLALAGLPTEGLRSKSWDEFAVAGAPAMDFVFTVCDSAAGEVCPIWPGHPMTAHWGFPDPAAFEGSDADKQACFLDVFKQIGRRIDLFCALPIDSLDRIALKRAVQQIGQEQGE